MSSPLQAGERFLLGFRGPEPPDWLADFAARFGLGGVVLFDYDPIAGNYRNNIESPAQLTRLTGQLAALPSRPLIAVDQEGGKVRRLKESLGFAPLPSAVEFHALPAAEKRRIAAASYGEMRSLGIDWVLAPVIDLLQNPDSPDIGAHQRAFSSDPASVAADARVFDEAAREAGLALCLKHYPGLGGADSDSHLALTDLSGRIPTGQLDLFHRLGTEISGGAIMLSHGLVRDWDGEYPVSLSPAAVGRLREALPQALILTDDLQMEGVRQRFDLDETCELALRAGADLLLVGNALRDEQDLMAATAERLTALIERDPGLLSAHKAALGRVRERKARFGRSPDS